MWLDLPAPWMWRCHPPIQVLQPIDIAFIPTILQEPIACQVEYLEERNIDHLSVIIRHDGIWIISIKHLLNALPKRVSICNDAPEQEFPRILACATRLVASD
jgi:hypothetical protein